jgi:hypothetical protein
MIDGDEYLVTTKDVKYGHSTFAYSEKLLRDAEHTLTPCFVAEQLVPEHSLAKHTHYVAPDVPPAASKLDVTQNRVRCVLLVNAGSTSIHQAFAQVL